MISLFDKPMSRGGIVPRDYQTEAHDGCYRLWDAGEVGALIRAATGAGKTLMASLIADTWLRRGDHYRVMVVSYETQLVHQFADELEDFLGMRPGIEMGEEHASLKNRLVVASRQSLLYAAPPTLAQVEEIAGFGIHDVGSLPKRMIDTCLKQLRKGVEVESIRDHIAEANQREEAADGKWSRVHKFDPLYPWLIIFDEAHRHAYHLATVGPLVDWFDRNKLSRRLGLTATPKRGDGVSIGEKMFPGVALDYPLYSRTGRCAVKDGYAVPYVQKYIEVEGVDFKSPELVDKSSESGFDDNAMAMELEKHIAALVLPMLELSGDYRTLIFSGRKEMAINVAQFINARRRCKCSCGVTRWQTFSLIGQETYCDCGQLITHDNILVHKELAREIDGDTADDDRKEVYRAHQAGEFQYLSVCGLCREGYNDPDIQCVAVFRPVSKKASSLAEQMKGRGCRPPRSLARRLHEYKSAAERCQAIADSEKPHALIIDLVGITGLADCASTVQIYAEGLPDKVVARAEELLVDGADDVEAAVEQAEEEENQRAEKVRVEREEAERAAKEEMARRAKAQAEVSFSVHDVGFGVPGASNEDASEGQWKFIRFLGMNIQGWLPTKKQAGRIINQLKRRVPLEEVARTNRIPDGCWQHEGPTGGQLTLMRNRSIPHRLAKTRYDASLLLDAKISPDECEAKLLERIVKPRSAEDLDAAADDMKLIRGFLPEEHWNRLAQEGRRMRTLVGASKTPPPSTPGWQEAARI